MLKRKIHIFANLIQAGESFNQIVSKIIWITIHDPDPFKAFQFIKKKLGKSEDEDAREYNQRRDVLYIYIPKRGYIRDLNHDCTELLYTDKEHEAKVFMYIDGIRGVLSYMKLVKNAGVTLPDYYIVTNGVKEQVAKIHF